MNLLVMKVRQAKANYRSVECSETVYVRRRNVY